MYLLMLALSLAAAVAVQGPITLWQAISSDDELSVLTRLVLLDCVILVLISV
jgi:hypothetical protein